MVDTSLNVQEVSIDLAEGDGKVMLRPAEAITLLLPNDVDLTDMSLAVTVERSNLVAPVSAGQEMGEAELYLAGTNYGKLKLIAGNSVDLSRKEFIKLKLQTIFGKTWVIVVIAAVTLLFLCYLSLVAHYRRLRQKHLKQRRQAAQRRALQQYDRPAFYDDEPPRPRATPRGGSYTKK